MTFKDSQWLLSKNDILLVLSGKERGKEGLSFVDNFVF